MSHYSFVHDRILRHNLDFAFVHIVDLLTISESESYKDKDALISSLRKTIIIHTASIIEALLLWKLKGICKTRKIELADEWKYSNIRILYKVNNSTQIIAGSRKKEEKNINRLDFVRITDLCYKYKLIRSKKLKEDINKVRRLRNRLHIGGLQEIEKEYKKSDLEFCFSVAKKIKKLVSR